MSEVGIAFLPSELSLGPSLAQCPTDALIWPLGCPGRLKDKRVGDMSSLDHLIAFPRTSMHWQRDRGTQARISLVQGEPSEFCRKHLTLLRVTWRRFHRVLTFNEDLLSRIPNGIFFPLGRTWVPDWRDLSPQKTRMTSLIASAKRKSSGHRLRHEVARWAHSSRREVDVIGRGYKPFEAKSEGLAPYRFSVVVENVREPNYFSEKLLDAVLCDTVPIYWGCPNLERFMEPEAVIQCASEADLRQAIDRASVAEYERLQPALTTLKPVIANYADLEHRAAEAIRTSILA